MPTTNPRFTVTIPTDLFDEIEQFRFSRKYKSQNSALIALVEEGLKSVRSSHGQIEKTAPAKTEQKLSEIDKKLLAYPEDVKQMVAALLDTIANTEHQRAEISEVGVARMRSKAQAMESSQFENDAQAVRTR